jgi:ABC-2 type transport system permease protein
VNLAYIRYELLRTFRNRRYFFLAIGFPLVIYYVVAGTNTSQHNFDNTGISLPLYFMVGLAAFGAMSAMLAAGGRIATERAVGWTRQLRLTPLSTREYFRAKVATSYAAALVTIVLLYIAGVTLGVRLSAADWLKMTALMLVGLIPFAGLGVLLGHLVTSDSIGPAVGGTTALLGLLGGVWFPITGNGVLAHIAQALPSYWLVQAAHVGVGGHGWGAKGWIVVAAWTVGATILARRAYVRDTKKT